jgi:putative selenate reductase FAD-binding subunit
MLNIREYVRAESLEQAWELNQKKSSRVLGGMLWLKMSSRPVGTAIDLSGLGLDQIEEKDEEFRIGCMVTLRELELHAGLNRYACGAVRECLRSIVGVQFRNLATVGGSIFGRFGFSDVMTLFLALDTKVELYRRGIVDLEDFAGEKKDRDILVRLIVKKRPQRTVYLSQRNTRTDFPVLACAASLEEKAASQAGRPGVRLVFGARPQIAVARQTDAETAELLRSGELTEQEAAACMERMAEQVPVGSNMRAGAEYRSHLVRVLGRRALMALQAMTAEQRQGGGLPAQGRNRAEEKTGKEAEA